MTSARLRFGFVSIPAITLLTLLLVTGGCEDSTTSSNNATVDGGPTINIDGDGSNPSTGATTPDELLARGGCTEPAGGAGTDHAGFIEADETWSPAGNPHRVTFDVRVTAATLTIEPCTVIELAAAKTIEIGSTSAPGKLIAKGEGAGASVRPIVFQAAAAATPWRQILIEPKATADITLAALVNGGAVVSGEAGALLVAGVAGGTNDGEITKSTTLNQVLIEKSASYGVNLDAWGTFTDATATVWIRNSGSAEYPYPVRIEPGIAGTLPTSIVASGNLKNEILVLTNKTFMHSDTFRVVGSGSDVLPYHVRGPIYVGAVTDGPPVALTIEAGVTVGFEDNAGTGITIGNTATRQGSLSAVGTADKPIVFTSAKDTKAAGDWSNLNFRYTPATGNRISHARIEYAGGESGTSSFGCGPGDNDSAIIIQGQGANSDGPSNAFIDNTTFDQIAGTTVIVSGWASDTGPDFSASNTFGASTPSCKVSRPRRGGAGDVCDGGRTVCWP